MINTSHFLKTAYVIFALIFTGYGLTSLFQEGTESRVGITSLGCIMLVRFEKAFKWIDNKTLSKSKNKQKFTSRNEEQFHNSSKQNVNSAHEQSQEDIYLRTLGITRQTLPNEIKTAYKELLTKYHPDKVSHLGPELQALANRKTQEIVVAYEYFKIKYDL